MSAAVSPLAAARTRVATVLCATTRRLATGTSLDFDHACGVDTAGGIPAERLFARGSGSLQNDRVNFLLDFGRVVAKNNVSFHVHLDLKIPESKDRVAEHDLGNRRLSALVRAISGETRKSRASYMTSSEIIVAEVSPSDGENSRQIFEFRILPD